MPDKMPCCKQGDKVDKIFGNFANKYAHLITEKNLFFLILLFSFILKGILVLSTQVPNVDGILYINAARAFSQGNFQQGIKIYPMPFYPFLISCFHYVIPDWIRAGQTISWLSMVFAAIPLYLITKILFGWKPAMWSITAYSLAPHFNTIASKILRDPLGLFMLSLAILFALKSLEEKTVRNFCLASIFSMLAFFCRVEFFLFPLFLISFYCIIVLIDREQISSFYKTLGIFIIISLCFGVAIGLLDDRSSMQILGLAKIKRYLELTSGNHFFNIYKHIYHLLKIMGNALPNSSLTGNFAETARHYIWFIYLIALIETIVILIFPINLIPLCYKFCFHENKYNRCHYFIIGIITLFTVSIYFFLVSRNFIQKRFLIIPTFLCFPWIGSSIYLLYNKVYPYKKGGSLAIGLFILFFVLLPRGKALSYVGEPNTSIKDAGLWFANNVKMEKQIKLIGNDARIPFFAGLDKNYISFSKKLDRIEAYACKRKAKFLFIAVSLKKKGTIPDLEHYEILKKFQDQKHIVTMAVRVH